MIDGRNPSLSVASFFTVEVRSTSCFASTYGLIEPPPQLKNTSGALGEPMALRSLLT